MRRLWLFTIRLFLLFGLCTGISAQSVSSQINPSDIQVLLIMDDDFGVSYQVEAQNILSIKEQLEGFGWELTVAGVKDTLVPCAWGSETFGTKPFRTDLRVSVIDDVTKYQAVIILPGRSHENLIRNRYVLDLISEADKKGLVLAAWCRGVRLLAAADVVLGKHIIGHMDYADEYKKAGAHYVRFYKKGIREFFDVTPPFADGNIITTVRSLFYRDEMCLRIKQAVLANFARNEHQKKIEMDSEPVWTCPSENYATGISWTDFNRDGWLDLAVSNGIDARPRPAEIYFSNQGELPLSPAWSSSYMLPGGNLFTADINQDDYPDLLVSHLGVSREGFEKGPHTLFLSSEGKLPGQPSWESPPANGFSCTGGDFDGDGDMDLVFGQGVNAIKPEDKKIQKSALFLNSAGHFNNVPDWESDKKYLINDVCAVDIDNDGDLDLCISGKGYGVSVFYNREGTLETSPSWFTDSILGARQMVFGDVDGDGFQELAVAVPAPKFYSEGGKFCLFKNNGGVLEKMSYWACEVYKEPSCVAWADVDGDGDLDLSGGGFFGYIGVFVNENGTLPSQFTWQYQDGSKQFRVQQISWGDYDQDCIINDVGEMMPDEKRKLFYMGKKHIQSITAVLVNDKPLNPQQYCYDLTEGWISLAEPPSRTDSVSVLYAYSSDLDAAVSSLYRIDVFKNKGNI